MAAKVDFGALRAQALGVGHDEEAVTVNTRALIDKVLARYSGEWTVFRELLQNAADASASKAIIKFETLPSATVPLPPQSSGAPSASSASSALLKHTIQHHTLKRLLVSNDGNPFGPNDWSRLKRIAEGNPDETKIGAFGVGFYSVFSDCEEPFVSSGHEALAFYWKGNSLFTRKLQLSSEQASPDTTFVLDYRNATSPIPSLLPLCQFLANSLTFVGLSSIELWLDDWKLLGLNKLSAPSVRVPIPKTLETRTQEGLMFVNSVLRETAQIEAKWLNAIGWKPKATPSSSSSSSSVGNHNQGFGSKPSGPAAPSLRSFFSKFATNSHNSAAEKAAREEREAQDAILEDLVGESKATVFLHVNTATLGTKVTKEFGVELERATKKPAPASTKIAVLTAPYGGNETSLSVGDGTAKTTDIFATVLPSKSGRIFIGFPTHQTTGLSAHISAQSLIPTVERESIDMNARWVRTWNTELLRATGIVCRIAWMGEVGNMKERLAHILDQAQKTKARGEDIEKLLPEAAHILNQFTFRETTPTPQVGSIVEEAFWTCNKNATIEILSTKGVTLSHNVRLASDELSFLDGIPMVPPGLMEKAPDFIQKLIDYGIIIEITTADIKKELENQALDSKQLIEFLRWAGRKARRKEADASMISSLLAVAIANDDEGRRLIVLGQIKHFINPAKIPSHMPTPGDTIAFKFTRNIERPDLEAIGWTDLQIVPWVRFLLDNSGGKRELPSDQDILASPEFASQVLPVLSKQWDGLSQSSKSTLINLLTDKTIIPTKLGLRRPGDAYFQSVKLFDDLPVLTVHSVKDKFLLALGVRKTIELNLIFERLLKSDQKGGASSTWSHVDLVRYLASVQNDIPGEDIKKLRNTPICQSESGSPTDRFRVSELFEPKDELRALGFELLKWPKPYRPGSEEGRFLKTLGLRQNPDAKELIGMIASATTASNLDHRDRLLAYMVKNIYQHGYSSSEIGTSNVSFLPLQDIHDTATPSRCFTNEKASIMGFQILRKDLHAYATALGVKSDPPIEDCALWLVKNPPQSVRSARMLFEYFATRLNDLSNPRAAELLDHASFVPIFPSKSGESEKPIKPRLLPPRLCFLGAGGPYSEIFDYVDFGKVANTFLIRCGSKSEPSTVELATMVVRSPAKVYGIFDSAEKYKELLSKLASHWSVLKKDKTLVKEMRQSAFLLGSREYQYSKKTSAKRESDVTSASRESDDEEENTVKEYQLAYAQQIAIVDDVINYNIFKESILVAPVDDELEAFYLSLGAVPLSSLVEEVPRIGHPLRDQSPAHKLRKLVLERIKLFLHDVSSDQLKKGYSWLERSLTFTAVSSLHVRKSLKGKSIAYMQETSAIAHGSSMLYFNPANRDLFYVSQALLQLMLHRPKPQQAIILTSLLEMELNKLRARGYDVSRILKKREAEAQFAEEQRRKQLEEEQRRVAEAETARKESAKMRIKEQEEAMMPGDFPKYPEEQHHQPPPTQIPPQVQNPFQNGGLFSSISRALGVEQAQDRQIKMPAPPPIPPELPTRPAAINTGANPPVEPPVGSPVTTEAQLQQNLFNAIQSARAHNSQSVISNPVTNEVEEVKTFCDSKPAQNISVFGETRSGLKIFVSNSIQDKGRFMAANAEGMNAFASVMLAVADAMHLSRQALHLFYDPEHSTIAFNSSRALFFNYHYFESLHLPDVLQGKNATAIVYWFVVACHELAHNLVADHSAGHSYYTENFVAQFFTRVAAKIGLQDASSLASNGNVAPSGPPPGYSR